MHKKKVAEDLQFAIKQKRENISLLKKLIEERRINVKKLSEKNQHLISLNRNSQKQVPTYMAKCQHFADYIEKTDERNGKMNEERLKLFEELKQSRVQNIQILIKNLFPISKRILKTESTASQIDLAIGCSSNVGDLGTGVNTVNMHELAEATRTAYIRGKWVLQDSQNELQHVIVAPSLPGNNFVFNSIFFKFKF